MLPIDLFAAHASGDDHRDEVRRRILVADDEPDHREMIVRAIAAAPAAARAEIVQCADGNRAWELLQEGVDLAFLDIQMPGANGLEILERIQQRPELHHVPVIIVTSSTDPRDQNRARAAGAHAFVPKVRYGLLKAELARLTAATLGKDGPDPASNRKPL